MAPALRVAVIGCGVVGRRRAQVASAHPGSRLTLVADVDPGRAASLANDLGCASTADWREALGREDVDAVVVSTTNDWLVPVTIASLEHGKHVLCEKPLCRTPDEGRRVVEAARARGRRLKTGFNHRHHPAIARARELLCEGEVGDVLFARSRYGHGGRPGYETEWRARADVSGGGELLDQGIHVIDLFRWFMGDFAEATGYTGAYCWRAAGAAEVEDNAFALFRTASGRVASLHASWTQWKNLFSFEVFGEGGYLIVDGLGGSYGPERLTRGRRRADSAAPEEEQLTFPGPDASWDDEWAEFVAAILEEREPLGNGHDGWQAVKMVHAIYESQRSGRTVPVR